MSHEEWVDITDDNFHGKTERDYENELASLRHTIANYKRENNSLKKLLEQAFRWRSVEDEPAGSFLAHTTNNKFMVITTKKDWDWLVSKYSIDGWLSLAPMVMSFVKWKKGSDVGNPL